MFAAVAETDLDAFRGDPSRPLQPSLILSASHVLAYMVEARPLGNLLQEAVDGGEVLHSSLWHPLRVPMFHRPLRVAALIDELEIAWEVAIIEELLEDDSFWKFEIGNLCRVYRHAAQEQACIVSAVEFPGDEERRKRVRLPWAPELPPQGGTIMTKMWQLLTGK